jgi:hypothetical protein
MSIHRIAAATFVLLVSSAPAALAQANSLFDGLGPRELALGESMRGEATGALATTLNPAGLPLSRELVLESGYGYRPWDGASVFAISACDSTVPVPGCFYYRFFTAEPEISGMSFNHRAHEVGYVAARAIGRFVIGATYRYFDYNSDLEGENEGDAAGHSADLGLTFVGSEALKLGFVGYNLVSTEDSANYPRAFALGLVLRPTQTMSLSADGLWNTDLPEGQSTGRYGGGFEYFIVDSKQQAGYPLRIGAVYDNTFDGTYVTGGAGYRSMSVGLDVGVRKQVAGGDELMVIGSVRVFAPNR